jgi:hypothetical protein
MGENMLQIGKFMISLRWKINTELKKSCEMLSSLHYFQFCSQRVTIQLNSRIPNSVCDLKYDAEDMYEDSNEYLQWLG